MSARRSPPLRFAVLLDGCPFSNARMSLFLGFRVSVLQRDKGGGRYHAMTVINALLYFPRW